MISLPYYLRWSESLMKQHPAALLKIFHRIYYPAKTIKITKNSYRERQLPTDVSEHFVVIFFEKLQMQLYYKS